jgi:hypothetical protein
MAIVIEGETKKVNIVNILTWLVVLVVIVAAAYYIFFAQPQLVEVVTPASFKNISPLANLNLNPEEVVSGASFQSLKQYVTPPTPGNFGRSNPFLPF